MNSHRKKASPHSHGDGDREFWQQLYAKAHAMQRAREKKARETSEAQLPPKAARPREEKPKGDAGGVEEAPTRRRKSSMDFGERVVVAFVAAVIITKIIVVVRYFYFQ